MPSNPLLERFQTVIEGLAVFREHARTYYYDVVMSACACPNCRGRLAATGASLATCTECSLLVDPTVAFQRSVCCDAALARKRTHYACTGCGCIVPSKFLFDEPIFDAKYFCSKMRESREKTRRQRREFASLIAAARSEPLEIEGGVTLPRDLAATLDAFVEHTVGPSSLHTAILSDFRMEDYRQIILNAASHTAISFDTIPTIERDTRLDRARRFMTLLFMEQAHEVRLQQSGSGILVIPCA